MEDLQINKEFSFSAIGLTQVAEAILTNKASFRLKAKGYSMLPFIRDGDVITISPQRFSSIDYGEIVAFARSKTGTLVIHRVIGKHKDKYIIKGDNIFSIDGFVSEKNILGVVTKIERNGKKVIFGLGFERLIIAFLSQARFFSFVFSIWKLVPPSIRKLVT